MTIAIAERTEGVAPPEPVRSQRAALLVKMRARRAAASCTRARALLTAAGVPLVAAEVLHDVARLRARVRAALDDGCDLIILGGGDGTISAVVDDLARHQAALGLLPLGTANDFARSLAIPTDLDGACAIIARGPVAAQVHGRDGATYFVNVVSVGLGATVIGTVSPALKRLTAGAEASKRRGGGMGMARSQPACPWCCSRKLIAKGRIARRVERPIATKVCPCPGTPERLQHGERHTRATRHGTAHCVVAVHDKRPDEPSGDLAQNEHVDTSPFDAVDPRGLVCRLLASSQSFLILLLAFSYGILKIRPYP